MVFCVFLFFQVGGDGVGYFVKMVYNGIEYGDMQVCGNYYFCYLGVQILDGIDLYFYEYNCVVFI